MINLSGWTLCGSPLLGGFVNHSSGQTTRDTGTSVPAQGFAMVSDGSSGTDTYTKFPVNEGALALHVSASSMCGGLSNSGGTINLSNGSSHLIVVYGSDKANGNGKTWEWSGSYFGESLIVNGTPGGANSIQGVTNDVHSLFITEFLPDPAGSDDAGLPQGEWVELYNPGTSAVDARGLVLYDEMNDNELYISDTTTIGGTIIPAQGFLVVYRNGDSDFSLNNDGTDEVRLFNGSSNGTLIDHVSYSGSAEGMSWSNLSSIWNKTVPTPGVVNQGKGGCDWSIDVKPIDPVFSPLQVPSWNVTVTKKYGDSVKMSGVGTVEDLLGNVIRTYSPWKNETIASMRTVSYSPRLYDDKFVIRFWIEQLGCTDNNDQDNMDRALVLVNPYYQQDKTFLEIKEIDGVEPGNIAYWGDMIRPKVAIYKGNSTKRSVRLWIENGNETKVSEVTSLDVSQEFQNITSKLPLRLFDNCKGRFNDGDYTIILDGLDKRVEKRIMVKESDIFRCTNQRLESKESARDDFSFSLGKLPDRLEAGKYFELPVQLVGDEEDHQVALWAYVFRGSKSYSGEREGNKKNIELHPHEKKVVLLPLMIDNETDAGNYRLKVKMRLDQKKTEKELTTNITVGDVSERILDFYIDPADKNGTGLIVKTNGIKSQMVGLLSLFGEQKQKANASLIHFSVPVVQGNNVFFAQLFDEDDRVLDVSRLSIRRDGTIIRNAGQNGEALSEKKELLHEQPNAGPSSDLITGRIVYESPSWKAQELAPWIFMGALVIFTVILVFFKV